MNQESLKELRMVTEEIKKSSSMQEKLGVLRKNQKVCSFLECAPLFKTFLAGLTAECEIVLLSLLAIGEGKNVFAGIETLPSVAVLLRKLIEDLLPVEQFYSPLGGIVGYHLMMIERIFCDIKKEEPKHQQYLPPSAIDISEENEEVRKATLWGIEALEHLGEIYPVGGAADRLGLKDEKTEIALPAARLLFGGKTLLQGMIADLQAKEYLYYKIYHKQVIVPIAMMTSLEKENHAQIVSILEEHEWFQRGKDNFALFCQPLVPTIDEEGHWCLRGPLHLLLKPGGHGVIWKLAKDNGIFSWFYTKNRSKVLIRQINNPVAGTDHGLLAFTGIGWKKMKRFGFAGCERKKGSAEGVDVLRKTILEKGYEYSLTNVEYCDFSFEHIPHGEEHGARNQRFLSNTNILFADLKEIEKTLLHNFLPGMLINLKKSSFTADDGTKKEMVIARLESTMQNIADSMTETFSHELSEEECSNLQTFITYNRRKKTISTVKKAFTFGSTFAETPEGCFLDILQNARDLLANYCHMKVPEVSDAVHFFLSGPSFLFLYHPALGPIYSIIAQKIRGGKLGFYSEMQLHLAEVDLLNVDIEGSLLIFATEPLGKLAKDNKLEYSDDGGKCQLKNVYIRNLGIDRDALNLFWKNEIVRKERCEILLLGNGEFYAENVTLEGNLQITVKDGYKVTAYEENGKVAFREEKISAPSWYWEYTIKNDSAIHVKKIDKS